MGLALLPVNAFWVITIEAVQFGPYPTTLSLLPNTLFWLALLCGLNAALRHLVPRRALSPVDLLIAYALLAVGSAIAGCDQLQILMHYLGHPAYAESVQPGSTDAWARFVPAWLQVRDPEAVKGYYFGASSLYTRAHLLPWLLPVGAWLLFIALLAVGMLSLAALLRRRWVEEERLPFPLVWLPVAMATGGAGLWRSPLFGIGLALAGGIDLWNGIAFLYPSLPMIPTNWVNIHPLFPDKPWSAMGWTTLSFYPMVIGLGYLLPLDLLFSCWLFFLLWKAQKIAAFALGWDTTTEFPYTEQQGYGAVVAVGAMALWNGRRYLAQRWADAWTRGDPGYRRAFVGLALALAGCVAFLRVAGLAWPWSVAFVALFWLSLLTVARLRAEFGAPVHDLINAAPEVVLTQTLGPRAFSAQDLTVLSLTYWFSKLHRSDPMPLAMEGMRLTEGEGGRIWSGAFLLAMLLGAVAGFWAMLHQGYALGNAARWGFPAYAGYETFGRLDNWLSLPRPPGLGQAGAMAIGAAACLGLFALRQVWIGCPLHPIALAITSTFQMNLLWVPLLIAWVVKGLTLKWGGRTAYERLLPLFYGLILGQAVVGSLWSLASVATGERMYSFWGY